MTRLHMFLFSIGTISLVGVLGCQETPVHSKHTHTSLLTGTDETRDSNERLPSAQSGQKLKTPKRSTPKTETVPDKPHLRDATQAEVLKLRRAGAVLRARVYRKQGTIQLPISFPKAVGGLFLGKEHAKLVGVEVFKGLNQLKRAPGHYFARIRYITLAERQALQDKLGLLMKSSGWANRYPDSAQIIRHTTLGELTWTIKQVVDQPTVVDIRAKLSETAFGDVKALNLVKRPPAWW